MLKFERKLREQLEKLASQLHETQHELNLTPDELGLLKKSADHVRESNKVIGI
jgi:hypothetical protein